MNLELEVFKFYEADQLLKSVEFIKADPIQITKMETTRNLTEAMPMSNVPYPLKKVLVTYLNGHFIKFVPENKLEDK